MGHQPRAAMERLQQAVDSAAGRHIDLIGEGWNFGEIANGARFVQASQLSLNGSGIGTFSDRSRDAIRGGNPFGDIREQGLISGLALAPNGFQGGGAAEFAQLLHLSDLARIGLAGDLADFEFTNAQGQRVRADQVDYFGQRAGYTGDPAEHIKYIEAHDNETLFDVLQLKLAADTPMAERVRVQNLGHSLMLLGQGIPFFHAGQELLRSKSGDRDSYNSGDWFNAIDWTRSRHGWGRGLPPAEKNAGVWPLLRPLLADVARRPQRAQLDASLQHVTEMSQVRMSSRLFRLRTGQQVKQHLRFHNTGPQQLPGLIAFELADEAGAVERRWKRIVVLVNVRPDTATLQLAEHASRTLQLHPQLRRSADARTRASTAAAGRFEVGARTSAVFVETRSAVEQLALLRSDVTAARDSGAIRAPRAQALLSLLDSTERHLQGGREIPARANLLAFSGIVVAASLVGDIEAATARALVEHVAVLVESI